MIQVEISIVPLEHIDLFWPQIEILLKPAADRSSGKYEVEDIYDLVTQYDYQLWAAFTGDIIGAAVSHQVIYPHRIMLCVDFWGGREPLEDWGELMLNMLKKYATHHNYDGIEATSRAGWSRRIKDYGYKKIFDHFELDLNPTRNLPTT